MTNHDAVRELSTVIIGLRNILVPSSQHTPPFENGTFSENGLERKVQPQGPHIAHVQSQGPHIRTLETGARYNVRTQKYNVRTLETGDEVQCQDPEVQYQDPGDWGRGTMSGPKLKVQCQDPGDWGRGTMSGPKYNLRTQQTEDVRTRKIKEKKW